MDALIDAAHRIDATAYDGGAAAATGHLSHAVMRAVDVRQLLLTLHKALRRAGYRGRAQPFDMATEQALTVYDADAVVCDAHAAQSVPANADLALLTLTHDGYGEPCAVVTHSPNEWRDPVAVRLSLTAPTALFRGTCIVCAVTPPCANDADTHGVVLHCLDAVVVAGRRMHAATDDVHGDGASWHCVGFRDRHAVLQAVLRTVRSTQPHLVGVHCVPYARPQAAAAAADAALHLVPLSAPPCHHVTGAPTRSVWRQRQSVRVVLTAKWMGQAHATLPPGSRGVSVNKPRTGGAGTRMAVAAYTRSDAVRDPWCVTAPDAVTVYGHTYTARLMDSPALDAALTALTVGVKKHARRGGGTAEKVAALPRPWSRGDAQSVDTGAWPEPLCAEAVCSVALVRERGKVVVELRSVHVAPHDAGAMRCDTRHALECAVCTAYDTPGLDAVQVVCAQAKTW